MSEVYGELDVGCGSVVSESYEVAAVVVVIDGVDGGARCAANSEDGVCAAAKVVYECWASSAGDVCSA